ncbi:hypothetical protein RRG08_038186 [Elysia crispata]|uniref:Uncharacterized protein n=1 Tax=Elysia crispata TaxID=231223 RepID=A0AAE1E1D2_9GAST|nr:hypothetical protein RRG08_038186 [Elysia crispata]
MARTHGVPSPEPPTPLITHGWLIEGDEYSLTVCGLSSSPLALHGGCTIRLVTIGPSYPGSSRDRQMETGGMGSEREEHEKELRTDQLPSITALPGGQLDHPSGHEMTIACWRVLASRVQTLANWRIDLFLKLHCRVKGDVKNLKQFIKVSKFYEFETLISATRGRAVASRRHADVRRWTARAVALSPFDLCRPGLISAPGLGELSSGLQPTISRFSSVDLRHALEYQSRL